MTVSLLILSAIFLVFLSFYALVFISLSLAAFFISRKNIAATPPSSDRDEITVLIPAYNDGEGLIDAVVAVKEQDYPARVEINILVKDISDNSLPELLKFYKQPIRLDELSSRGNLILFASESRCINLILTGQQTKKDKLNFILPAVTTPLVAFLDADHRPTSNWLSSSVGLFQADNMVAVQTRRRPLGVKHLAQIWDSSQNHLGHELLNNFLSALKCGVFFTGTAAVFKTDVLRLFNFSDSITEDTYLSYDLWCHGYRIAYNNQAASYEEVSSSFRDYIFRRRRWSAGHTQTFFSHFWQILKAPLPAASKLVLFLHGGFYLVPLLAGFLIGIYGLYFFRQLGFNFQLGVILSAVFFGWLLAYGFRQSGRRLEGDWLIASLWLYPQLAIWAIYIYKLIGAENYYYILIFPYTRQWFFWHAVLFLAPLVIIPAGYHFFKDSRKLSTLWVIPTYIFTLFLDIYACALGFWDFLWGRSYWSKIRRRNLYSAELLPPDLKSKLITGRPLKRAGRFWLSLIIVSLVFLVVLNDLLAVDNCGETKYFLWRPLVLKGSSPVIWQVSAKQSLSDKKDQIKISLISDLKTASGDFTLKYYIDDKLIKTADSFSGQTDYLDLEYSLGWDKHTVRVSLNDRRAQAAISCQRELSFATTFKELRGRDLYVNNEKFLVKGLIPSFNNNQIDLDSVVGFAQIKATGANVLRFYHRANEKLLKEAADNQLLVIDQPDRSTWNELDLASNWEVKSYIDRYQRLIKEHQGEPYVLWDGLGNEWELGVRANPARGINLTNHVLADLAKTAHAPLTSYSTYYTFIKYPVDISGINMLDTGRTYWEIALNIVKDTGKPFYASELGGFVAFWEKTDSEMRINRLLKEWPLLLKAGALGANFYESHDNWAQPVVIGYNDPFKADQPDDTRGFWDERNEPKPELKVLEKIFADMSVEVGEAVISDLAAPIELKVKNIRAYSLKQVMVTARDIRESLGDFAPGEVKSIKIVLSPAALSANSLSLRFDYTSHAGLKGTALVRLLLPLRRDTPVILNDDFVLKEKGTDRISGRLLSSDRLDIILPDQWQSFIFNGEKYKKTSTRLELPVVNPDHPLVDLEFSRDGASWSKVPDNFAPAGGRYFFRFYWPSIKAEKQSLVLAGLGTDRIEFLAPTPLTPLSVHSYRENVFNSSILGSPQAGDLVVFKIERDEIVYIDKASAARGLEADFDLPDDVQVKFERPRIFAPLDIEIRSYP